MPSLTSGSDPLQGKVTGHHARSIRAARERNQVEMRQQWEASWLMRAWSRSHSRSSARNVLMALLLLGKGGRIVEEPATRIADVAGIGLDLTRRCIRELRTLGEISIIRRGGGGRRCNVYRIDILPPSDETGGDAA